MSKILVTGGAGYIGSHMSVELLQAGYEVIVVDSLVNSSAASLDAVQHITQRKLEFIEADLRDKDRLSAVFQDQDIDAVLHFAGLKAVGESVAKPALYYDNNINGTLQLLDCMQTADVKTLVFSSSATVYGMPDSIPITEECHAEALNPYGRTKLFIEELLRDQFTADPTWRISVLRYFNPVGAHASGEIGEDPNGIPNNLLPYISQVAVGKHPHLCVFGDDYPTPDGTGIRDYIHVVDLVRGHLKALQFLAEEPVYAVHNLGTGNGYSVLEVLRAFEAASGKSIGHRIVDRRAGDAAQSYADPAKAERELDWRAEYDLAKMCEDAWRWQAAHPNGYR